MTNKLLYIILSLMMAVAFAIILFNQNLTGWFVGNQDDVSSKIINFYELVNPNVDVTVEKIEDVSGVYKVLLRFTDITGTRFGEVYATKDGKFLTESMIMVEQSIAQLGKLHNFVDCLASKDVRIAGITNHTATTLQFNVLGGSYAFTKLYLSCDDERAQECIADNITQVPTVVYQSSRYSGVQSIQFLENLTACKF